MLGRARSAVAGFAFDKAAIAVLAVESVDDAPPDEDEPLVFVELLLEPFDELPFESFVEPLAPPELPVPALVEDVPLPFVLFPEVDPVEDVPVVELLFPLLVDDPPEERLVLSASISGISVFKFNRADSSSRP
jgi:hypothetical protein